METDGQSLCTATRDQNYVLSGVNAIEDGWKGSYLGRDQTTDKKCWNGKVPMVIRSHDVIGPFSA